MFEAHMKQSSVFKKIIEALKELLNEAIFECTETGIQVQAMDNAHVTLISLYLSSEGFDTYHCDRNISIGINLGSITKIMKYSANDDTLTLTAENDADKMQIIFKSKNQDKFSDYEMRLMNLDHEHLGIPDTDYSCVIKLPSLEFSRICKDLGQFGDSVVISCSKEGIKFSSNGDIGVANIKLVSSSNNEPEDELVSIIMQEHVSMKFAIRYLSAFTKATPLSSQVELSMSDGVPLLVKYKIGEIGHIRYFLAPKIDDDDT